MTCKVSGRNISYLFFKWKYLLIWTHYFPASRFEKLIVVGNIFLPSWQIRFIDNTDPAGIDHQIAQLGPELASTLIIVISKVSIDIILLT